MNSGTTSARNGLIGIFEYLDDLVAAIKVLREKDFKIQTVYSPVRNHQIIEALGLKSSPVRYFVLIGALLGIATGFALAIYTAVQWRFIVSGKPPVAPIPYVILGFEFCILMGVLWNVGSLCINTKLPKLNLPGNYDPRCSRDRFGLMVLCEESEQESVASILTEAGAEEVHETRG